MKTRGTAVQKGISEGTKAASRKLLGLPERPLLRSTDIPGVYLNADNVRVNEAGLALSVRQVKEADAANDVEVLGHEVRTPAELLKRVALDTSLSLYTRLEAAKAAAPYYDRKMPTALEGGDPERPLRTEASVVVRNLNALAPADRKAALALLERLGVLDDGAT